MKQASGLSALLRDYRQFAGPRLSIALTTMVLGAVAEGFGLLMIVPLASVAIGSGEATLLRFAPWAAVLTPGQRFVIALLLFLAAMVARSLLLLIRDLELEKLANGYENSLRLRAAATLARRGWSFASQVGQAGMQSLLLNDVPRASHTIQSLQQAAVASVMLLVQLALTAWLAPALTGIALLFLVIGALGSMRWNRRGARSGAEIVERMGESTGSGFRLHAGLKAALAQGTVGSFLEEYRSTLARSSASLVEAARDYSVARQLAALGSAVAAAALLYVGVRILAMPFAVLVTSLILFARMSGPALALQQSLQRAAATAPSFAAIVRRLGKLEPPSPASAPPAPLEWSELRLDDAGFDHGRGLGLAGTSLALSAGRWIGLAGPSGSGKTTLLDLVAGLIEPRRGSVTVDGRPLEGARLERWRRGLAYVGQDGSLFKDSVRANLLAEGSAANEEALWEALRIVGLETRVRAFAGGLDESVGDRGSQLSGGERQRLVLARALLRKPSLLILDEATAALDSDSEALLLERLRALDPRPAALVVAHRQSSLAYCDSILAIQHQARKQAARKGRKRG
jgi:ABC-type bacteriocin/lantibiotic exporter with double-glycine peptidase domain